MIRSRIPRPTLLADIGGTNARFAILDEDTIRQLAPVATADHPTLEAAMEVALAGWTGARPTKALLAVAGPVDGDRMQLTNAPWEVNGLRLRRTFDMSDVRLVNDFAAVAWSMPGLDAGDLRPLAPGEADPEAPIVTLGPGTGLGVAAFLPGRPARVVAGEGGHGTLPAADPEEEAVIARLRARFGHVSAERALSGPGLANLRRAISECRGVSVPDEPPQAITRAALDGSCAVARAALEMFCAMLGGVAGNLALTFRSAGGVRIAGGIAPRIADFLAASRFHERFVAKGRFRPWLETVPVAIVTHPAAALVGLARLADED
ncbi:glucokinase [Stella humosa]|uniref:Glucokinase n=1 Tax=Stella humosa TaxID=94 RepID=A0A3N1MG38_9PROT|nr:glucokinase [Stella humosa]ROQ01717.1 glucokinase [Stella humosa]BBK32099.1 glucokinase [Stella humosa]